jgi:Spy/CpxP family protein refolding chaperone
MKTKWLVACVACLLLFAVPVQAQGLSPSFSIVPSREGEDFVQSNRYPGLLQLVEMNLKLSVRSLWEGGTVRMADELLGDPDIRRAWGVAPGQYLKLIHEARTNVREKTKDDPETQRLQLLMNDVDVIGGRIHGFDEETMILMSAQGKRSAELMTIRISNAFDGTLTPEQRQTMNEAFLASMSELPVVLPDMFEALDLTDAQKQQMEEIKKELDAEFEKTLDDFVAYQMVLRDMLIDEHGKQELETIEAYSEGIDHEKWSRAVQNFREKTEATMKKMADTPEYKKIQDALQSKTKAFSTRFKTKMFDVLTDAQWHRLQELVDNPPEHAKALLKKLKEQRGEAGKAGAWQPGPGTWQPGDPIPVEYGNGITGGPFRERRTNVRVPQFC